MKRNVRKRILSMVLIGILLISNLPSTLADVLAADIIEYMITVTDGENPVPDAEVKLAASGLTELVGQTNGEGIVRFDIDKTYSYQYSVNKVGYDVVNGNLDITSDSCNISLHAKPTLTVTGNVKNPEQIPVVNAQINITGYNTYETRTDGSGTFTVDGIYAGENYQIAVVADSYKKVEKTLNLTASNDMILEKKEEAIITFSSDTIEVPFGSTVICSAASGHGASVQYTSSDTSIVTVNALSGELKPVGLGTATIIAYTQEDETHFSAKNECTVEVTIGEQQPLIWEKTVPQNLTWKDEFSNAVTGGSGTGIITYASSNKDVAKVDHTGKLEIFKPGKVTITAIKAGDGNYKEQTAEYILVIGKANQETMTFENASPDDIIYGDDDFTNAATGGSTDKAITYKSSDTSVVTVDSDGKLITHQSGTVTITATRAGNELYNDVSASYTITVKRAQYTTDLEFAKTNDENTFTIAYQEEFVNVASGGSGQSVQYSSSNPEIATVDSSGKVTTVNVGDVIITATCPENNQYEKQEISYRLVITAAEQSVEFAGGTNNIPAIIYGDEYQNKATAKTKITYTSSDSSIASVDAEGKIDTLKSGTVIITAIAEKTEKYEQASSSYTLTINKADQNIMFEKTKEDELKITFNDNHNTYSNQAKSDKGVTTCQYSILSGPATIMDSSVGDIQINGAGMIDVKAEFAETDCYNSAEGTYRLIVEKDSQEIAFENASYTVTSGENMDTPNMAAPVGEFYGTSAITYSIVSDSNQIIEQLDTATGKVTLSYQTGTATIRATKAEDANYLEATAEYTITVRDWDYAEQLYILTGEKTNDSGWYTGNVSVKAAEGYSLSYKRNRKEADWKEILQDAVTENGKNNEISFYVKNNNSGYISEEKIEKVKIDKVSPSASVKIEELSVWEKFLTFMNWKSDKAEFRIDSDDDTSGMAKKEYYIEMDTTDVLSAEELDAITDWKEYVPGKNNVVSKNTKFVIYAKVTDNAGNYTYASTNGIVFDGTAPEVSAKVITEPTNNTDIYTKDVEIEITATDAAPYSGIQKVSYIVKYNGQESTPVVVYDVKNETYTDEGPKNEDLKETIVRTIVIDAETYNYDDVEVEFTVLDNAGNKSTTSQILNINVTDPDEIQMIFEEFPEYVNLYEDVEYYNEVRTAQIEIKGRKSVFATPDVTITAQNAEGKEVVGTWKISKWESVIDETNPDETLHKATITFNQNAVYNFTVDYTDAVGRSVDTYVSPVFVVDQDIPQAKITVKEHTWTKLLEKLTFGLYSSEAVVIEAESKDETSPIKSVEYIKVNDVTAYTEEQLKNTDLDWKEFSSFTMDKDEKFVVYLKVTDYAEQVSYIGSDGYIIDTQNVKITIRPEETDIYHEYETSKVGIYNDDVDVQIDVKDIDSTGNYSGIQKVEYWVTKDGEKTREEVLYEFDYVRDAGENSNGGKLKITEWYPDGVRETTYEKNTPEYELLQSEISKTITVNAKENNSCNVVLYVKVTDNAGLETVESIPLDIDVSDPEVQVSFGDDSAIRVETENDGKDRGYFDTDRTATVTITERTAHFESEEATDGIEITGTNGKGEQIELDLSKMINGWTTVDTKTADEATHTATVTFDTDANYTFGISYTDKAMNSNIAPVDTKDSVTPERFTVDKVDPESEIYVADNKWNTFLQMLTFGLYSKTAVDVKVSAFDQTSPMVTEYYVHEGNTALTKASLDEMEWTLFTPSEEPQKLFAIDKDKQSSVYVKVTDYAGHCTCINSDGYIVDMEQSGITITPEKTDIFHEYSDGRKVGMYKDDVAVQIDVVDEAPYSGIQKVEYWVTNNGERTQGDVLYYFEYERTQGDNSNGGNLKITEWYPDGVQEKVYEGTTPTHELLKETFSKVVTVDAEDNNSCNVVLYVQVTDNAGHVSKDQIALDIDITEPVIEIKYDNNNANKIVGERGYFNANRTAEITITERTAHFDANKATAGISITGVNGVGKEIEELDLSKMINGWTTVDTKAADEATHTATVTFDTDANYSFSINYVDKATNENILPIDTKDSVTPYYFTVDKAEPYGKITVGNLGWWDKLIDKLTFGLWSKITVHVDATAGDKISPIESVDYYKTASTKLLQEADLKEITDWKTFSLDKGFEVKPDEQFTVYLRIIDYAGHVKYISSNGVIVDDTLPVIDGLKPEITINPMQPVNDIYNTTTGIYVKVVDPIEGDAYAGLKEIRYEVYNMDKSQTVPTQSGVLFSFDIENPTYEQLRQQWEAQNAFEVLANEANDSNNIIVKVYAVDNAGNENVEQISMKMDITKPTIHVSYDNNAGDTTFGDGTYFKENRTATIVLTERNFSAEYVDIQITDTHGNRPVISGWTTVEGTGNKNNTTHTARITYAADGDYTFAVSCKDLAGNENTPVDTGNSLSPYEFTIDKTVPTVSVSFDNNQSLNGNYYDAQRTMTITVHEHNFETSRVKVTLNATDEGSPATIPSVNGWTSSGDTHTAIITFANDALYTFDFAYTDKAGNQAADVTEERFYVDKTKPLLEIYGINDESANNGDGNIGFVMEATDTNFDVFKPVLTAVIRKGNSFITEELDIGVVSTIARGKSYTVTNLDLDGIYRITCTVIDKAGNAYEKVVWYDEDGNSNEENRSGEDTLLSFSVNREGSVYEIHDKTRKVLDDFYVQNVKDDVLIYEINADTLGKYEVTLNDQVLKENVDYKVSKEGGNGSWMKYTYAVSRNLFENEGEYILVVSSQDKAENNAFSDVKEASVHFVVDRTAPIVSISGLANDGRYETEYQKVVLIPTDDGGALKSLIVQTVDDEENTIKELVNLSGVDLLTTLKENDGKITFEVEKGMYQNIKIICDDAASYENEENVIYEEIITNVTITPNKFLIFWANTMLRNISLLILLMLLCATGYIVYKKRKNK